MTYRIEGISTKGNKVQIKNPFAYSQEFAVKRCTKILKQINISHCFIYRGDLDNEDIVQTVYPEKSIINEHLKT